MEREKLLLYTLMAAPAPENGDEEQANRVLTTALRHGLEHGLFDSQEDKELAATLLGTAILSSDSKVNILSEGGEEHTAFGDLRCVVPPNVDQRWVFDVYTWRQLQNGRAEFMPQLLDRFSVADSAGQMASIAVYLSFHLPRLEPAILIYGGAAQGTGPAIHKMQAVLTQTHPTERPPRGHVYFKEKLSEFEELILGKLQKSLEDTGLRQDVGTDAYMVFELKGNAKEAYDMMTAKVSPRLLPATRTDAATTA